MSTIHQNTMRVIAAGAALLFCFAGSVSGQTFDWNANVASGHFDDADNWVQSGAPTAVGDTTQFLGTGTHTVLFAESGTLNPKDWVNLRTLIGSNANNDKPVTFDLGGGSYELTAVGTLMSAGLRIGDTDVGSLTVTGGTLESGSFVLGRLDGGNGTMTVTGSGTTWITGGSGGGGQSIADAVTGTLHVLDNAWVQMGALDIGRATTSVGELLISGAGTTVTNSGDVLMARIGSGQATARVENGATWEARNIRAGIATSQATIIVDNATLYSMDTGRTELYGTTIIRNGGLFHEYTHQDVRVGIDNIYSAHTSMLIESEGKLGAHLTSGGPVLMLSGGPSLAGRSRR